MSFFHYRAARAWPPFAAVKVRLSVLLGLDVLAAWHLHLDGPRSRYSVE